MIKKIKKYRINIRPSYAFREAKKRVPAEAHLSEEELEKKVDEAINKSLDKIVPSSLYVSYSKPETPEPLEPLWQGASKQAITLSVIISTIGIGIEQNLEQARLNNDLVWESLLQAVARESLEQCNNFVLRLIEEECKEDNCELSASAPISQELLKLTLAQLDSGKADIIMNEDGVIFPQFTSAFCCFWMSHAKKHAKVS